MTNARQARSARDKAAELRAEAAKQEAKRRNRMIAIAVAALAAVIVAGGVLIKLAKDDADARTAAASAPPANLVQGGYLLGNSTAKATIDVWEDFQCPACKSGEEANAAQLKAWAEDGTAKIIYHPVSILDRFSSTEYSSRAANAAAAVINAKPEAFPAFHQLMFANQPPENSAGLSDDQLIDFAVQAGVDKAAIESDIRDRRFASWVKSATEEFSKKGYGGTPTYVINGTVLKDWGAASLKSTVEAAAKG